MATAAYTAHWRTNAYRIVESWQDSDKAVELLDRASFLEDLSDTVAGMSLTGLSDAIGDALLEVECDLEAIRDEAISTALSEWEGETDEYTQEHLEDHALTVAKALAARRRYVRDTRLVPVTRMTEAA